MTCRRRSCRRDRVASAGALATVPCVQRPASSARGVVQEVPIMRVTQIPLSRGLRCISCDFWQFCQSGWFGFPSALRHMLQTHRRLLFHRHTQRTARQHKQLRSAMCRLAMQKDLIPFYVMYDFQMFALDLPRLLPLLLPSPLAETTPSPSLQSCLSSLSRLLRCLIVGRP